MKSEEKTLVVKVPPIFRMLRPKNTRRHGQAAFYSGSPCLRVGLFLFSSLHETERFHQRHADHAGDGEPLVAFKAADRCARCRVADSVGDPVVESPATQFALHGDHKIGALRSRALVHPGRRNPHPDRWHPWSLHLRSVRRPRRPWIGVPSGSVGSRNVLVGSAIFPIRHPWGVVIQTIPRRKPQIVAVVYVIVRSSDNNDTPLVIPVIPIVPVAIPVPVPLEARPREGTCGNRRTCHSIGTRRVANPSERRED